MEKKLKHIIKIKKIFGVTLIELMITIAIVATLMVIAVASYEFAYQRAYESRTKAIIMSTALAEEHYYSKNSAYLACSGNCAAQLETLSTTGDVDITVAVPTPQNGTFTITGQHQKSDTVYVYNSTTGEITEQ